MSRLLGISKAAYVHRAYSSNVARQRNAVELSSARIRDAFLEYFVGQHQHTFIRSSPVVPFCDPTIPFVNAGMCQFKNIFLDEATAPSRTAANSQKCIRIGGKHNDLNIIGTDGYHHTFFEMLGNWSFGDYFKEKACQLSWNLLTECYMIDPSRLYVTYFGGDQRNGLPADEECKEIWRRIGVPDNRILAFGSEDNFWDMGLTGPCGACTEIHIDHIANSKPEHRAQFVNAGVADLTELWNIVFIEYNRKSDGSLEPLRNRFVDTGMGFERLVTVLQGKLSNYDTDLFSPIFDAIAKESRVPAYSGTFDVSDKSYPLDYAYRLVADHARMCSISIADGLYPQVNQRLQKIMRKTINTSERVFKTENLLQKVIIPQIVNTIGHAYPELDKNFVKICETFAHEDHLNRSTREKNRSIFKTLNLPANTTITEDDVVDFAGFPTALRDIEKQKAANPSMNEISVDYAYNRLYGNFGLNEDLIEKLAHDSSFTFDSGKFVEYQQVKKLEAKAKLRLADNELLERLAVLQLPDTECQSKYDYKYDESLELYRVPSIRAQVLFSTTTAADNLHHIILDKTNFYHTAGGQCNDIGQIISSDGKIVFNVKNVEPHKGLVIHSGHFSTDHQEFNGMAEVNLIVDEKHRTKLTQHHSCMHLLQAAMKQITGQIVFQQASNVSASSLKCTLGTIGKHIDTKKMAAIEQLMCDVIRARIPIQTEFFDAHELYALDGLTTIPGVIYPDRNVRVLKIIDASNKFTSMEPCCGTHATNTSELQNFSFKNVKSDNHGLYEIEAVCGDLVDNLQRDEKQFLSEFDNFMAGAENGDAWHSVATEANRLKLFLYKNQIPYLTKEKRLAEIVKTEKTIRAAQKAAIHDGLFGQIITALDDRVASRGSFIVHVFDTAQPLEESSIASILRVCQDLPALILNVADGKIVAGRASIPRKFADESFNAHHWMAECIGSLDLKCEAAVKKEHLFTSRIINQSSQSVSSAELDEATMKAKAIASKMFDEQVVADKSRRDQEENELLHQIKRLEDDVNKDNLSIGNAFDLDARTRDLQKLIKNKLLLYTFKERCSNDLIEISHQIHHIRQEMEKRLFLDEFNSFLENARSKELPCHLYIFRTKYAVLQHTMQLITDSAGDLPVVIINIATDDVIGRVSVPLDYTTNYFTAKHIGDEFNDAFDGKCRHDGTRYEQAVSDFLLNKHRVNTNKLDEVFARVTKIIDRISKR